ncbi:hypothetical protein KR009_001734 [Drosophila setifemur]|nr:hypothetical protein KR009_001734 [Drosophila setifemur]
MFSRFLLIAGLMMLSWQWANSMPRSQPESIAFPAPPGTANNQQFPSQTVVVQSIFEVPPKCREGEIPSGPRNRCHRIA